MEAMLRKFFLIAIAALLVSTAMADVKLNYGANAEYASQYVFRGIPMTENAVFQTSLWVGWDNVKLSVWGNMQLDEEFTSEPFVGNPNNNKRFTEIRYNGEFTANVGKFVVTPGLTSYNYPDTYMEPTVEVNARVCYPYKNWGFFVNPIIDVQQNLGAWATEIGASYKMPINDKMTINGIAVGVITNKVFTQAATGVDKEGLFVLVARAELEYALNSNICVKPYVSYSTLSMTDVRDSIGYDGVSEPDNTVFGVVVGAKW